jgi:TonB family protein
MENIVKEFPDKNTRLKYSFFIAIILEVIFLLLIAEISIMVKNYMKPVKRVKPMLISVISVPKKKKAVVHHKKKVVPVKKIKKVVYKKPVIRKIQRIVRKVKPINVNKIPVTSPMAVVHPIIQQPQVYHVETKIPASVLDKYFAKIKSKIVNNLVYSRYARKEGMKGYVDVLFKILRNGDLVFERIEKSSQYGTLNRSAIKTIKISAPFPAFPNGIKRNSLTFLIKIHFKLKNR